MYLSLPAAPAARAIATARHIVASTLTTWHYPAAQIEAAQLVVGELFATAVGAVAHDLQITDEGDAITLRVGPPPTSHPAPAPPALRCTKTLDALTSQHGRGTWSTWATIPKQAGSPARARRRPNPINQGRS
ncbi:hypothetical protein H8N00_07635 [Streptomyces sp. AC563]|uniref:hypothetical protein n=1 Tax=Streptomyces buecherae TaxID=2763006 RepID=UPI00164D5730|nr:hypothetical protein [Streptomyces buecherae]MBC3988759.1 hypothetical protein [Streptomyces buecherae]